MGFTLKDLVAGSGVDLLPSDEEVTKEREIKHRNRTVLESLRKSTVLRLSMKRTLYLRRNRLTLRLIWCLLIGSLVHLIGKLRLVHQVILSDAQTQIRYGSHLQKIV